MRVWLFHMGVCGILVLMQAAHSGSKGGQTDDIWDVTQGRDGVYHLPVEQGQPAKTEERPPDEGVKPDMFTIENAKGGCK